tara:strand:+ start:34 stop:1122 length:1089 start_codon:yes stop_codon:yes gene_type:complete
MSPKGKLSQFICYLEPKVRILKHYQKDFSKIIFVNPGSIPNSYLHSIYKREINIIDFEPNKKVLDALVLKILYSLNYSGVKNISVLKNHLFLDSSWIWNDLPNSFNFNEQEQIEGKKLLRKIGINDNEKFIVLHLRESHYYENYVDKSQNPEAGGEYYNRNPKLESYQKAINYLINKGFKVVKTGFPGSECSINIDGFIDYANKFRSEFGDLFLHANAELVISGACGNFYLASLFKVPSILTNSYHFEVIPMLDSDMSLPITYREKKTGRLLNVSEMLNLGIELSSTKYLERNNIEIIPNSEDELLSGIKEMLNQRIASESVKISSAEEHALKKLFRPENIAFGKKGEIASIWVNTHKNLLK